MAFIYAAVEDCGGSLEAFKWLWVAYGRHCAGDHNECVSEHRGCLLEGTHPARASQPNSMQTAPIFEQLPGGSKDHKELCYAAARQWNTPQQEPGQRFNLFRDKELHYTFYDMLYHMVFETKHFYLH